MTNNNSTADAVGVVEAYMQALQIKDTDTILRLYADEAEIIPENRPSLRGRDAVDSFYASTFAAIGMEVNVKVVSTEVYDEIAIVRSEQPVTVIAVADGTRTQAYFRELFVLRRTPDGWRIHKYMFSQNLAQA